MTATSTNTDELAVTIKRPDTIGSFVGQSELMNRLNVIIAGSKAREVRPPHILFSGAPGLGKTSLAAIVANELNAKFTSVVASRLQRVGDIANVLFSLSNERLNVLFIDEIHSLPPRVEEVLYEALEDGRMSIVSGTGAEAQVVTLNLPQFVCIGATTLSGLVSAPLRDRFGFHGTLRPYTDRELGELVARHIQSLGVPSSEVEEVAEVIARCARQTPRIALHLTERVLDFAYANTLPLDILTARLALKSFGLNAWGLTAFDRLIVRALVNHHAPMGIKALSQVVGIPVESIERENEQFLIHQGLVVRGTLGRSATALAHQLVQQGEMD